MAYLARMTNRGKDRYSTPGGRDSAIGWTRIGAGVVRLSHSFRFAARGIWTARSGANFKIQLVAAGVVIFLAMAYGITGSRLGLVVVSIAAVLSAELINTVVERICDFIAELHGIGRDPRIRDIKDLAAGAVLIVALGALAVGFIVFSPLLM
jgi:diacylglycerol kinase